MNGLTPFLPRQLSRFVLRKVMLQSLSNARVLVACRSGSRSPPPRSSGVAATGTSSADHESRQPTPKVPRHLPSAGKEMRIAVAAARRADAARIDANPDVDLPPLFG